MVVSASNEDLGYFWCAVDNNRDDSAICADWGYFKTAMSGKWTNKLLQTLLLMTAMVNCQVPLSAITWARDRFVPVSVQFSTITVIGLLAKHACRPDLVTGQPMLSVGRHPRGPSIGKDLVLADPRMKVPVGLIPDFYATSRPMMSTWRSFRPCTAVSLSPYLPLAAHWNISLWTRLNFQR